MKKVFDMLRLDGKTAMVTGSHAWLGYDIVCALAEAGANIVMTSRNKASIEEVAKEISKTYGVKTMTVEFDQRNFEAVSKAMDEVACTFGTIDILVNNAGGGSGASEGNLLERDAEDIREMIDINLTGMLFCCKAAVKYMIKQKSGKIINLGSIAGIVGRDRAMYNKAGKNEQPVDYAAAKGGVISATRDLAGLLSPHGICVNSISPGGFDKGDLPHEFVKLYSEETPLGRMGKMGEDIKGAALLLASAAGDYITGHNLVVDGGFSIWK
ncbi:MAG: SDR family oxidoreductase [Clostridia bacterium]|nr:SDR family oxidoreductase [Clostridia bacterium]